MKSLTTIPAVLACHRVALASLAGFDAAALSLPKLARAEPAAQPDIAALWHAHLVTLGASTVAHQAYADAEAELISALYCPEGPTTSRRCHAMSWLARVALR